MKRLLSLLLVVVMLFAVLAMVGCDKDKPDDTTADTKPSDTTASTPEDTTKPVEDTTKPADDTTKPVEDTTKPADDTTKPADDTTTKEPDPPVTTPDTKPSESTEGTTLPVFARFDFGTKTKAEAEGLTSHEYLTGALTYDHDCVAIEYTEDTIVIYAMKSYTSGMSDTCFELCFDDIITYDFDGELKHGWGSWVAYPFSTGNVGKSWQGRYQYMKVRILNDTANNMISFRWHRTADGYSSTMVCSNLYLQGGAPATTSDAALTATPTTEWKSYTYDIMFLNGLASGKASGTTYIGYVNEVKNAGSVPGNNLIWTTSDKISAIRFSFLGALSTYYNQKVCDSRVNIKEGAKVEVDYVVFGASIDQLAGYTSYLEDSAAK